jgi:crossover junction endodeoxyribonuclease RuvC
MLTVGIDPGTKGAVGVLIDGEYHNVFDIPTVAKGTGRLEINPSALAQLIKASINYDHDIEVALEKVSAMPGNGSASMFSFGDSYGCCRSVIACLNLRMMLVSPAAWKRHFHLDKDKENSRALAIRLFPTAPLHLKKHSDRAEALLMARYLWETRYK